MKKVLYFHHVGNISGATKSLGFLLENIDRKKYIAKVYCPFDGEAANIYRKLKIQTEIRCIKPFHGSKVSGMNFLILLYNLLFALPTYFTAKKIMKNEKPDIIHLNSSCLFMVAKAAKKIDNNIKVVCHIREPLLDNIFGKIIKNNINKYTDFFIAIDKNDAMNTSNDLEKTEIIYNFVDFNVYNKNHKSSKLREELNIKNTDILFLVLARVDKCNGIIEITRMWNKIFPDNSKYKLVIVGDNESNNIYCKNVRKQRSDNVFIEKFRNDVVDIIASSDVMLCPFTQPHFSRAVVEAQAMGKPCLINDIDGVRELIVNNETGIIYNSDFSNLEECIKIFGNNKNLGKMKKNAYYHALKNFNSEINAERTFKVYEK